MVRRRAYSRVYTSHHTRVVYSRVYPTRVVYAGIHLPGWYMPGYTYPGGYSTGVTYPGGYSTGVTYPGGILPVKGRSRTLGGPSSTRFTVGQLFPLLCTGAFCSGFKPGLRRV